MVNKVSKPKSYDTWVLKYGPGVIRDPDVIAESFNNFFKTKIDDLKANIDKDFVGDPLFKLKEDWYKKRKTNVINAFSLKPTNIKSVRKGAIIRTRGTCSTFQSVSVVSANVPCTHYVHRHVLAIFIAKENIWQFSAKIGFFRLFAL